MILRSKSQQPTTEEIEIVEALLKHEFPQDYKDFITIYKDGIRNKKIVKSGKEYEISSFITLENLIKANINAIDEWGYPRIGTMICNCPSAGHDAIFLNYNNQVVHIDQESNYKITKLANSFSEFVHNLRSDV